MVDLVKEIKKIAVGASNTEAPVTRLNYGDLRGIDKDKNRTGARAIQHNWQLRIEGGSLRGDLFGVLKNRGLEKLIDNLIAGVDSDLCISCTSSTLPSSKVKVLSQKIRGISVHQAAGIEGTQGNITLTAYEFADYRLSKLFEAWKFVEANRYTASQDSMARLSNGVNLDLLTPARDTIVMTYRLLETYCTDYNIGQLGNDPSLTVVTFNLAYMNYDVLGTAGDIEQADLGNSEGLLPITGVYGHPL